MPESIDWPPALTGRPRRRGRLFLFLAVLAGILFGSRTAFSYYVDVLWFGSLGYGEVFWKTLSLQSGIFTTFFAATFVILYGSFFALKRAHLPDLPDGHTIFVGGQPVKLPVEPVLRLIALGVSLAIAVATGAAMMSEWPTLCLLYTSPIRTEMAVIQAEHLRSEPGRNMNSVSDVSDGNFVFRLAGAEPGPHCARNFAVQGRHRIGPA